MHIITIEKSSDGCFNVLPNGHSYRIHRNLPENRAAEVAEDARRQFCAMKQRSVVKRG